MREGTSIEHTENTQEIEFLEAIKNNREVSEWITRNPLRRALFVLVASGVVAILPACSKNEPDAKQLECLMDNVFFESSAATKKVVRDGIKVVEPSESKEADRAIALVTLARVASKQFPKSICAVVHQPRQFSWTSWTLIKKGSIKKFRHDMLPRAQEVSRAALEAVTTNNAHTVDRAKLAQELDKLGLTAKTYWYKRTDNRGVSARSKQWFEKHLNPIGTVPGSSHTFFEEK